MIKAILTLLSLVQFAQAEWVTVDLSSGNLNARPSAGRGLIEGCTLQDGQSYEKLKKLGDWYLLKTNKPGCPSTIWIHSYYTEGIYQGPVEQVEAITQIEGCLECKKNTLSELPLPVDVDETVGGNTRKAYEHFVRQGVPAHALAEALEFYQNNLNGLKETRCLKPTNNQHRNDLERGITNQRYIVVVDYTKSNKEKRGFFLDMKTGEVKRFNVAHGRGSSKGRNGVPHRFTNRSGKATTVVGPHITSGVYSFKNCLPALRLDGVSWSNNGARGDGKVAHVGRNGCGRNSGYYVDKHDAGRSRGCPAVDYRTFMDIHQKMADGALWYHYTSDSVYKLNKLKKGC